MNIIMKLLKFILKNKYNYYLNKFYEHIIVIL
jgi:hypothetical protein